MSYSHLDNDWLERLRNVLRADIENDRIDYWDDLEIQPGAEWHPEILDNIDRARVAVLLVSPNFLASRFIMEQELPRILQAAENGLTVLWVPLSGTFYGPEAMKGAEILNPHQALFDTTRPLDKHPPESQTARLVDLSKRISNMVNPARVPCNLPFVTLGKLFKGRETEMGLLDEQLRRFGYSAITQPQVISGLGGIGKTRLALEYALSRKDDFTALLFVSANSPGDLAANLAKLSTDKGGLDLTEYKFASQEDQYAAVIRWLQRNKGWLLILDNVDTEEAVDAVQELVAQLSGGHILITSRYTRWGEGIERLPLDVIPQADAVALLLESTKGQRAARSSDIAQAEELAKKLGCLPLALRHAAAYLVEYRKGFEDYLGEFDKALRYYDPRAIQYDPDPKKAGTLKTVATTYFMSFDRLGPVEKAILRAASFLAPEPIPAAMFENCPEELQALVSLWCEEKGDLPIEKSVPDALARLSRFSLVERSDDAFSIHRMEQLVLSRQVPKDRVPKWVEATRAALVRYAPDETAEDPKTWPVWDRLRPHAETLVELGLADDRVEPSLTLMGSLAALYYGKGLYLLDLHLEEKALGIAKRTLPPNSGDLAHRLLCYGESLHQLGRNVEAEAAFKESLAIREKTHGPDSLRVAEDLNYLAMVVEAQGRVQEAEALQRRVLAIYTAHEQDCNKHAMVKSLANLGGILLHRGAIAEAEPLLLKAHELAHEHLGDEHPHTLMTLEWTASLSIKKGEMTLAIGRFRQAAAGIARVLGKDHHNALRSAACLAQALNIAGELSEAEPLFGQVLQARERVLGREHPDTLSSVSSLAALLQAKGDYAAAEPLFRRVLDAKGKTGQTDQPQFAIELNNHALLLRRLKRFDEAAALLHRAIGIEDRSLPPDHPKRAHRRNNLAIVRMLADQFDEAWHVNAEAWSLKVRQHDVTSGRILFSRIALCWLRKADASHYLGQLRTLLAQPELSCQGGIDRQWAAADILDHLRSRFAREKSDLLVAIVAALNEPRKVADLERFDIWRSTLAVPLEARWPDETESGSRPLPA